MEREKFFIGLTSNGGFHWEIFQARPDQATAEQTGYIAVGEGFENQDEATELRNYLNAVMFNLATVGLDLKSHLTKGT